MARQPGDGDDENITGGADGADGARDAADEADTVWHLPPWRFTEASDDEPGAGFGGGFDGGVDEAGAQGGRPPRGRRSRILRYTAIGTAVVLAALLGVGGYVYAKLDGNLSTFDASGLSHHRPPSAAADARGHKPENILLIGSDSRAGSNEALGGGNEPGARSDTTILLHVYADHKHAVGVSIPRDAIVGIPSCKLPDGQWSSAQQDAMFNSAFAEGDSASGNVACTQNTVEKLTGIRIDHTVVIDFSGFAGMTDALGGVQVCVPNAVDSYGIHLSKGIQTVQGQEALSYVRARHGFGDNSDVGRMKRQQAFMSSLLKKMLAQGVLGNPVRLYDLANVATRSMTVDPGLDSVSKLLGFADSLHGIKLSDVSFVTPSWRYDGSRIALVHPDVDVLWRLLREDRTLSGASTTGGAGPSTAPTTPPSQVQVAVYNGTGTNGLAGATASKLQQIGFDTRGAYTATSPDHTATTITYGPGQLDAARELATRVAARLVAATSGKTLTLTLGSDFVGVGTGATGSASIGSIPASIAQNTRPADTNVCSDISYGA